MGKHSIPAYECPKRGNTAPASACTVCSKRCATVDMQVLKRLLWHHHTLPHHFFVFFYGMLLTVFERRQKT